MGYGSVLVQGLLGGVMGASSAAAKTAGDEIREKVLRDREAFLSKLREGRDIAKEGREQARLKQTEQETADFYSRTGPQTRTTESPQDVSMDGSESVAEKGIIASARKESDIEVAARRAEEARKTGKKNLIEPTSSEYTRMRELDERRGERKEARQDRYADRDEAREDRKTAREEARADRGAARGEAAAARKEAREQAERLAKMAADRDWKVDAEGYYRRPDGTRVTERVRVEGRGYEEVPIKAPAKGKTRAEETFKENLDSINRIIEQTRKDMNDPMKKREAEKNLPQLLAERDRLMGKPDTGEAGPVKPKSQAEFDALPKGARYVNPSDGRIYIKK